MSGICWNVCGLENHDTFLGLHDIVRTHSPSFVFLNETKISQRRAERIRVLLGFAGCFAVDCSGKSSRLILFWSQLITATITSFSIGHIDAIINETSRS